MEQVILVDKNDNQIGLMEKLAAHRGSAYLHRAISVLLYRKKKRTVEVLLQQRGKAKPLWPLYWADTTSTHPRDGESLTACAVRRLKEEMGIQIEEKKLRVLFPLIYHAKYDENYSEREVDYILIGEWDGVPKINKFEAEKFLWAAWDNIKQNTGGPSTIYAPWFILMFQSPVLNSALV